MRTHRIATRHLAGFALVCGLALTLALVPAVSAGVLYAPHYNDDQVHVFATGPDGSVSSLAGSPVNVKQPTAASGLIGFLPTPDGRRAAAAYLFEGGFQGMRLGIDGLPELTQNTTAGAEGFAIAVSPESSRVYIATRTLGNGIRIYDVAENGALDEISGSPVGSAQYGSIVISSDGRYLFAASVTGIDRYSIGVDGALTPSGALVLTDVAQLALTPDGRHLLVLRAEVPSKLSSYLVGEDGSLSFVEGENLGNYTYQQLTTSPDSRFAFVPVANDQRLAVYSIAEGGQLAHVGDAPGPVVITSLVTSVDGRWIYAADQESGGLVRAGVSSEGAVGAWQEIADFSPSTPVPLSLRSAQAPQAKFVHTSAEPGKLTRFDAGATTIAVGQIGDYEWDFGDGTRATTSSPTVSHRYAKAGVYSATLTARDSDGCGPTRIHTGLFTLCNGSAQAVATARVDTLPVVSRLAVKPKKFKRGYKRAKVTFRLNEAAAVSWRVQRPTRGRTVGKSCRKETRKNRRAKRCTRWVNVGKAIQHKGRNGNNTIRFRGKVGSRVLGRGSYRISLVAVDTAGGSSTARTARFSVRR